jgi:ferredoxin
MKPLTADLHFMSGTGNSYRVATWVCEALTAQGTAVRLEPIGNRRACTATYQVARTAMDRQDAKDAMEDGGVGIEGGGEAVSAVPRSPLLAPRSSSDRQDAKDAMNGRVGGGREAMPLAAPSFLGLFFPTHGFTAPWPVLHHACRLPSGRGTHAIVMPTRAGSKVGSLFLPGLEGTGGYLVALILALKGYSVRGVLAVDMPSNFMIAHPGFDEPTARAIIGRGQKKTSSFMETILGGRRRLGGWLPLLLGLVLLPVSLAYSVFGRFLLAKMMFSNSGCTGCGQCSAHCPFGAIRMQGRARARPYWTFSCESCLRCMAWCPNRAVESGHSLGALLAAVSIWPVPMLAAGAVASVMPLPASADGWGLQVLVWYVYALLALLLTYAAVALAIRASLLNKFFTFTTLVHYYRRYHEPDTNLKDLDRAEERCESTERKPGV